MEDVKHGARGMDPEGRVAAGAEGRLDRPLESQAAGGPEVEDA